MRRLVEDRRGGVAVLGAVAGGLMCLATAAGIDLGMLALHARRLQGAADLAALSAARDLARAESAAQATARANVPGRTTVAVRTETGVYAADRARAPDARFQPGADGPNAARVTLSSPTPLFFARWLLGKPEIVVTRHAVAATTGTPKAMFSLGSRLARLDGGVANAVLSGLTGSEVSLSALDYRALADLDVNLLQFSDALAARAEVTAGDYDGLLATQVDAGEALGVLETLAGGADGGALGRLSSAAAGLKVDMGELIGVDAAAPDGLRGGLDASVSALDLVTALLEIGGGDRQIALDLAAPTGLADLKVSLAVGERPNRSPWLTVTASGDPVIRTAQARLYVRARTAQKLSGLAQVELPVLVEIAASEARLERLSCSPVRAVALAVRPGVARAMIGTIDERRLADFKTPLAPRPATVLTALGGLVRLDAKADVEAADQAFGVMEFDASDIAVRRTRTVASRGFASGLTASLLGRLEVTPVILGGGLGLGDLTKALGQLLAPLGPVLDGVINPVLDVLGLKLGEADATVHGLSCPAGGKAAPRLVG